MMLPFSLLLADIVDSYADIDQLLQPFPVTTLVQAQVLLLGLETLLKRSKRGWKARTRMKIPPSPLTEVNVSSWTATFIGSKPGKCTS